MDVLAETQSLERNLYRAETQTEVSTRVIQHGYIQSTCNARSGMQ